MRAGIIGAGFAGLSAGYYLSKKGIDVVIFESQEKPGGLAIGYKKKGWDWPLEEHYHHWFTSDLEIKRLSKLISHSIEFRRPKTSTFAGGKIQQLDSPTSLLAFDQLPLTDRLRTAILLGFLKITPFWKPLERISSKTLLKKVGGSISWKILWKPLFQGKFAEYSSEIPASWFWARIKKRSPSLGYPKGGFETFAHNLAKKIKNQGGQIIYGAKVQKISKKGSSFNVECTKSGVVKNLMVDKVISTLPFSLLTKIVPQLPPAYKNKLSKLKGIGATNLVLRLKKPFLTDGTYWLNVNENGFPFISVVEHTNFISKTHYGNEHLVYVGKYLPFEHKYFGYSNKELFNTYEPFLKKINPDFRKELIGYDVFKAPFAQPIFPLMYSRTKPPIKSPIEGLFLATMQQVYPWDRGTNYAVEIGKSAADIILKDGQ